MSMTAITYRPKLRLISLLMAFILGLTLVGMRLVYLQGISAWRFEALAAEQRERRIELLAQRGSIYDRDGAELAMTLEMKTLFANPRFVSDPQAAAEAIAPILGSSVEELTAKLTRDSGFVYLQRKVEPTVAEQVMALGIPGIDSVAEPKRFYPNGGLGAHMIGFVGMDNEGLAGIERRYDALLQGRNGELLMERDPRGRPIPVENSYRRSPVPGDDLVLTIDREIQYQAEAVLAASVQKWSAAGGTIIVLDPRSGEILALANNPTFDPNSFKETTPEQRTNRAIVNIYEPGSVNKVITAAAALEAGVAEPGTMLTVPDTFRLAGKTFSDAHPHPTTKMSFSDVIEQSSNVGTIMVAQDIGKERLHGYLDKFGFGRKTGLDFPGEAAGILPDPKDWWGTSMGTIPIGQGVAVTALQMAQVYATVANGGVGVQPRMMLGRIDPSGELRPTPKPATRRVIKAETAEQLAKMLVRVTEGKHGTGKAAAVPGYQVAGKTGTAQKPRPDARGYEGYMASFLGFAPASNPALVVAVILDDPDPIWGGVTAAPAFKEVMQFSLRHLGIGPGPVLQTEGAPLPAPVRSGGGDARGGQSADG